MNLPHILQAQVKILGENKMRNSLQKTQTWGVHRPHDMRKFSANVPSREKGQSWDVVRLREMRKSGANMCAMGETVQSTYDVEAVFRSHAKAWDSKKSLRKQRTRHASDKETIGFNNHKIITSKSSVSSKLRQQWIKLNEYKHVITYKRGMQIFGYLDKDKNGALDGEEVDTFAKWYLSCLFPDEVFSDDEVLEAMDAILLKIDQEKENRITFRKFITWYVGSCNNDEFMRDNLILSGKTSERKRKKVQITTQCNLSSDNSNNTSLSDNQYVPLTPFVPNSNKAQSELLSILNTITEEMDENEDEWDENEEYMVEVKALYEQLDVVKDDTNVRVDGNAEEWGGTLSDSFMQSSESEMKTSSWFDVFSDIDSFAKK
jgi:hypothetical protein